VRCCFFYHMEILTIVSVAFSRGSPSGSDPALGDRRSTISHAVAIVCYPPACRTIEILCLSGGQPRARVSGTFTWSCSAALLDAISHYTSARDSVGCGIDPGSSGTKTREEQWREEVIPRTSTHIKHVSREGLQEFLATRCIKNLGQIIDGAMHSFCCPLSTWRAHGARTHT
jgi:hypothetical protein